LNNKSLKLFPFADAKPLIEMFSLLIPHFCVSGFGAQLGYENDRTEN
jgi:hypothetical protein